MERGDQLRYLGEVVCEAALPQEDIEEIVEQVLIELLDGHVIPLLLPAIATSIASYSHDLVDGCDVDIISNIRREPVKEVIKFATSSLRSAPRPILRVPNRWIKHVVIVGQIA